MQRGGRHHKRSFQHTIYVSPTPQPPSNYILFALYRTKLVHLVVQLVNIGQKDDGERWCIAEPMDAWDQEVEESARRLNKNNISEHQQIVNFDGECTRITG